MRAYAGVAVLLCAVLWPLTGAADTAPPAAGTELHWKSGPLSIPLADQAVLDLPAGFVFLDADQTKRALRSAGHKEVDGVLGLISENPDADWSVFLEYNDSGYVKDDDARNWDADAMLKAMQQGTEEVNERRKEKNLPPLLVTGWAEKPHYDSASNKVLWAVTGRSADHEFVNFNTLSLGRHGYISMNLVTGLQELPQRKPYVETLLKQLRFVEGKRYADFNSATDKVAAVGLAALVAGVAAKTGLLGKLAGLLGPLLILLKKLGVVIAAAVIALYRTLTGKKKPS
ncbi:MAG TPA: DUF2167 domain-containing protein [Gammaproteobacteria bacterium]|nr:DUF2167 domain-containing protein [Gammaproteobacteria bacterium]